MSRTTVRRAQSFFRYLSSSDLDKRWGLYLTGAGEARVPPGAPYPPPGHPEGYHFEWHHGRVLREYQIVYLAAGGGRVETLHHAWRVQAGMAFMIHPGLWHRYRPDPATGWTEHWVSFDGAIARRAVRYRFFSPGRPVYRVREEPAILAAHHAILVAVQAGRPALQQVASAGVLSIMSLLHAASSPARSAASDHLSNAVNEAMRLLADPAQADLPLPDLARRLGLSYTWFRRMFTQRTGRSPHQFRLQLKLNRARSLLADPKLTVKEAAFRSGFDSEQYFCRLFRQKTGVTPGEWRKSGGGGRGVASAPTREAGRERETDREPDGPNEGRG
jgi:AraC-like DNA-binding protein